MRQNSTDKKEIILWGLYIILYHMILYIIYYIIYIIYYTIYIIYYTIYHIKYNTISYHILYIIYIYYIISYIISYYIIVISRNKPTSISSATAQLLRYSWPYSPYSHIRVNKTRNVHINVELKRVRVTTVAVRKQYLLHILSVCP